MAVGGQGAQQGAARILFGVLKIADGGEPHLAVRALAVKEVDALAQAAVESGQSLSVPRRAGVGFGAAFETNGGDQDNLRRIVDAVDQPPPLQPDAIAIGVVTHLQRLVGPGILGQDSIRRRIRWRMWPGTLRKARRASSL